MIRSRIALSMLLLVSAAGAVPAIAQGSLRARTPLPVGIAFAPGDPVPPLEATDLLGKRASFPYDASKATLVNFWATWCEPCRRDMPVLQELFAQHGAEGLRVVGILLDEVDPVTAIEFAESLRIGYPLLRGTHEIDLAWGGIHAFPVTFLIDSRGRLLRKYVGVDAPLLEGLRGDVAAALEGRALGPQYVPVAPETAPAPQP